MTKKPAKVVKKKPAVVENVHSLYNQEFRYPSLLDRIINWAVWISRS